MWALLLFFPSFLFAGLVPHVPGACTTRPTRQVWSPLRDLSWPKEPMLWGAWFNVFGSRCRPYFACWILHQQRQRDMKPSLRKLKCPDQTFLDWVRGDYESREHVISYPLLHVVTSELKFIIAMSVLFASSPDSFSCAGRTVAFTRWNTLQRWKVDLSLLSQLQRSLSFGKFTHGTGWRMKISTSGPEHASSWRKLSRKSSRSTSDHVALHTGRIPYILLPRNVRYYLFCSRQKLCSCAMLWLQPRVGYYVVVVCERHLSSFCNICVDVNLF